MSAQPPQPLQPRGSLRDEQKRLTRGRLLDAAVSVFAAKSFVDATMDDIASSAGVARVTVYAHFPSKGDIIQGLATRVYTAMGDAFADLASTPRWTAPTVKAWLDGCARRWREFAPTLWVVRVAGGAAVSTGNRDSTESLGRYVAEQERYAAMLLADEDRWRAVPPPEARQRALMVVLQTESFLTAWTATGIPMDVADPLDLLADSLCHLLGPALG